MPSHFTHRPLQTDAELQALHRMMIVTFTGEDALADFAPYHQSMALRPDLPADARRGLFDGTTLVSGCVAYARSMRIGRALVPTACVGSVMTHPEYRGRGFATRLIEELTTYATDRGDGLLLLDGINNFYDRFGYVSVHNWTQFTFQVDEILDGPRSAISVRPAAERDLDEMLQRYRDHFAANTGSFMRTRMQQRHYLRYPSPYSSLWVAEGAHAGLCGHMKRIDRDAAWSSEISADGPDIAVALLQHHALDLRAQNPHADAVHWLVPPQSDLADWLADQYEVIVRTPVQPNGGWMARPADLNILFQHMIPSWQFLWLAQGTGWRGRLGFRIGEHRAALKIGDTAVESCDINNTPDASVTLSPGVFTQLCFGYRSVRWAADQTDNHIPPTIRGVLDTLFPRRQVWITGSDFF